MPARKPHEGVDNVYAAAQKWVDAALRSDDSLFTPGKAIWTPEFLGKLHENFLDRPKVLGNGFYGKLQNQLEGSPPEVYQLMAEALYFHFLIVVTNRMGTARKKSQIEQVLGWGAPVSTVPEDLVEGLTPGIAWSEALTRWRPYLVGCIVETAEQWKRLDVEERRQVLSDPWAFKRFVMSVEFRSELLKDNQNTPSAQRESLLHLVFPNNFEGTVAVDQKQQIASALEFAPLIAENTQDVDHKLAQIRYGLEVKLERDFDFYDDDVRKMWDVSYWVVQAPEDIQATIESERFIAVHFIGTALGDLGDFSSKQELRSRIESEGLDENPRHAANQLWRFVKEIEQGDYVLAPLIGRGLFHVGRVKGDYAYKPSHPRPHHRSVEWLRTNVSTDILNARPARQTVNRGDRHREDIDRLLLDTVNGQNGPRTPPVETCVKLPKDLAALAAQLFLPTDFLREIDALLTDKRQVIFQGPPGTGKTYVAQKLARHLAGSEDRVTLVQFHPSYAYEDFVQGFRPTLQDGQAGFVLRDGPLLRAAERARKEPDANHFLIIDEINRGNIAKVFGELYYLLEYRDDEITLQYQEDEHKKFSLPKNLYIIGTMNTADRSIALVDLALRRRFYFVEFHPDAEPVKGVLRRWLQAGHPSMEWVADVVERVNELLESDRHAAIGPSYFMRDGLNDEVVKRVWKHSVLPYIEERRFGGDEVSEEFDLEKLTDEVMPRSDCIADGLSLLLGISKEEAVQRIEAEGGTTRGEVSSRWESWHAAYRAAGLTRVSFPRGQNQTLSQIAETNQAFIARVRMHLVTVIDGELFDACGDGVDMGRRAYHYWVKDDSDAETGE